MWLLILINALIFGLLWRELNMLKDEMDLHTSPMIFGDEDDS